MVEAKTVNLYEADLGEFHLMMKLGDSELIIEAEHLMNASLFKLSITNEHTAKLSIHLFTDIGELYPALIDAIEQKSPSTTINIDENGKISYKLELLVGSVKLDKRFEIKLEEQKLNQNDKMLRMIEKLTKKVLDQEKIIKFLKEKISGKFMVSFSSDSICEM